MAELPNRDDLEARFAKKFGRLARKHMHEFRDLLGTPADINNVPESFWVKMQDETDREMFAILLLIWSDSAELHGWTGHDMSVAAMGFASMRAAELGTYWAKSTRTRLEKGFDKLNNPIQPLERTVNEARETNARLNPYQPTERTLPDREELDHLLDVTFGPHRVETIAIDETTAAQFSGGESGVDATVGLSDDDRWRCDWRYDNVCEICSPLDDQRRSVWSEHFPEGPPTPHPRCRCWIQYSSVAANKSLPERFSLAWHRTIPNAAEWRAWCFDNGVDHEDRARFKSYNPNEARDESGKWTGGKSVQMSKKPQGYNTYYRIQPKGLGVDHTSETSNGKSKYLHVVRTPAELFGLEGHPHEYGGEHPEVVEVHSPKHRENGDVEGVEVDPKQSVVGRRWTPDEFAQAVYPWLKEENHNDFDLTHVEAKHPYYSVARDMQSHYDLSSEESEAAHKHIQE